LLPMLTLTALEEGDGLRIRTSVVTTAVWKLPLPGGEQLELVLVPGGDYGIGSPQTEQGRDWYANQRDGCKDVNVEAKRTLRLGPLRWLAMPSPRRNGGRWPSCHRWRRS